MQYMVIERFLPGKVRSLYTRYAHKGRMLPEGVHYIDSWINEEVTVCYQLMDADSPERLREWINQWSDLADFEVIPVISSEAAKEKVFSAD